MIKNTSRSKELVMDHFLKNIKKIIDKNNPIILELGAHKGYETRFFLGNFKDLKIFCFEPDPRCIKSFKENICDNRCILIEAAISNYDGTTFLNLSSGCNPGKFNKIYPLLRFFNLTELLVNKSNRDWDYSSSIKESISRSKQYPWLIFKDKIKIETIKLDSFIKTKNINHIDLIFSDIQGAEKEMIEGAIETLNITNYLYTEYGETSSYRGALTRKEMIDLLSNKNFELVEEYSSRKKVGNLLFKNKRIN